MINPNLKDINWNDSDQIAKIIQAGENAARKHFEMGYQTSASRYEDTHI
jgi:hypothetical protein